MLTAILATLIAGTAYAGPATDTSTSTSTSTETGTVTSTSTTTVTATLTATSTTTSTASRTLTATRTSTSTRTSSITMTFTFTSTPTATATATRTFTRTSTPSFTATTTGTPSGQRIKLGQMEGFLTEVPTVAPGATSADLFTLQKMFAAQFESLAHGGSAGAWYDNLVPQYPLTTFVSDTGNVLVGGTYARWQFPFKVRALTVDYFAITASGGGGSETFEYTDGTNSFTFAVASGTASQHNATSTLLLPSLASTSLKRNASTVGTTAANVTFTIFYERE